MANRFEVFKEGDLWLVYDQSRGRVVACWKSQQAAVADALRRTGTR